MHLLRWIRESNGLTTNDKLHRQIQLDKALTLPFTLLPGIWESEEYGHSLPPELGLSIVTLGLALNFVFPQIMGRESLGSDISKGEVRLWGEKWFVGKYIKRRFEELGWCPNDFFRLCKVVSVNSLCYLATVPRTESVGHLQCHEHSCIANNIDEANYRT